MDKKVLPPLPTRPWKYNPSSWNQRIRIALGALVAAAIALYLGLYQWRLFPTVWDPFFGEGSIRVLDSDVSHTFTSYIRIPDGILGALAYFSDAVFAIAGSERRWQDRPWLVVVFGIDVIPLGIVSFTLVVLQGIVVGWWCFLCLITACISLLLVILAYDEVVSSCYYVYKTFEFSKSWKITWNAFWGIPSMEAYEAGLFVTRKREAKKNGGLSS